MSSHNIKQAVADGWINNKILISTGIASLEHLRRVVFFMSPKNAESKIKFGFSTVNEKIHEDKDPKKTIIAQRSVPAKTIEIAIDGKIEATLIKGLYSGLKQNIPYDVKSTELKSNTNGGYTLKIELTGDLNSKLGAFAIGLDEERYIRYAVFRSFCDLLAKSGIYRVDPMVLPDDVFSPMEKYHADAINNLTQSDIISIIGEQHLPYSSDIDAILQDGLTGHDIERLKSTYREYSRNMPSIVTGWFDNNSIKNKKITISNFDPQVENRLAPDERIKIRR